MGVWDRYRRVFGTAIAVFGTATEQCLGLLQKNVWDCYRSLRDCYRRMFGTVTEECLGLLQKCAWDYRGVLGTATENV